MVNWRRWRRGAHWPLPRSPVSGRNDAVGFGEPTHLAESRVRQFERRCERKRWVRGRAEGASDISQGRRPWETCHHASFCPERTMEFFGAIAQGPAINVTMAGWFLIPGASVLRPFRTGRYFGIFVQARRAWLISVVAPRRSHCGALTLPG